MPTTTTRRTGISAKVFDDNLNSWTDFAGSDINVEVAYKFLDTSNQEYEQAHWSYRGQAGVTTRTTDGAIVRVRLGDGTNSDRTLYRQIVTDPTDPDQWTAWTQIYGSGSKYAVAIEADASAGAGYRVFHSDADELYVDNVSKIVKDNIVRIKPTAFDPGRVYFCTVEQDTDLSRTLKWWYTPDINAATPTVYEDCANYRWYRHDMVALTGFRFRSMAHEAAARHQFASETLTCETTHSTTEAIYNTWDTVRFIKGPSGQAGFKAINNLYFTSLAGAYYLFYNERHFDLNGSVLSNLKNPLFWQRSMGFPYYLSAPTPVGYSIWGFAGAVEWGNHVYVCGNGRVLQRPKEATEIDLSNYVIEGEYSLARDNQKNTGRLICANPNNVLGAQLGMTDADTAGLTERRVELAIGQKDASETDYEWKRESAWWISRLRKLKDQNLEHLEVELGDFWHRLENPFIDTIIIPSHFEWNDWQPEATNDITKGYSNDTDEFHSYRPSGADANYLPHLRTTFSGDGDIAGLGGNSITLYTGWRGENGFVRALLWASGGLVFRYQDKDNFYIASASAEAGTWTLKQYKDGTATPLASGSWSNTLGFWLEVDFRWKRVSVALNFNTVVEHVLTDTGIYSGFVGTSSAEISNLWVHDWNATVNTREMLRVLLAYADEHTVEMEGTDEENTIAATVYMPMGPQSDLDTPEKAFRQNIEASRLQVVWLEDD